MEKINAQLIPFLLGIVASFIASVLYEKYKAGRTRKAAILRRREEMWRERLASDDAVLRRQAYEEITMKIFRYFILGNVMFGISGVSIAIAALEMMPIGPPIFFTSLSNLVTSLTSLISVIIFGVALSWIKLYLKYSKTVEKEIAEEI